jgi:hypothetical protein
MNYKRKKQSKRNLRYLRRGTDGENKRIFQKIVENDYLDQIKEIQAGNKNSGF